MRLEVDIAYGNNLAVVCGVGGPGRIQCFCSSNSEVPKWGLYGVAEQKASGAEYFILALGLFWDIVTGLP